MGVAPGLSPPLHILSPGNSTQLSLVMRFSTSGENTKIIWFIFNFNLGWLISKDVFFASVISSKLEVILEKISGCIFVTSCFYMCWFSVLEFLLSLNKLQFAYHSRKEVEKNHKIIWVCGEA